MVARLSTNLLLSTVLASAGDARKFLRARNSIGVVDTTTGSNGRILNEDINMDDYAQLELINKSFMVPVAPLASEETGEQAISIDWTEVIVPIVSSTSLSCIMLHWAVHSFNSCFRCFAVFLSDGLPNFDTCNFASDFPETQYSTDGKMLHRALASSHTDECSP